MKRSVIARAVVATALSLLLAACSSGTGTGGKQAGSVGSSVSAAATPTLPYDVTPLLRPSGGHKYFGVATAGAPDDMKQVNAYTVLVGKQPNLLEYYAEWGAGFDASGVRNAWKAGALTLMSWEPFSVSFDDIASGGQDAYVRTYAAAVRKLNLPVVMDFADEFNGGWDAWGTKHVTAKQFVAAWRHIHDVFDDLGVTNVIWAWSPNIINPVPGVGLKQYYPGDAYVDWVGMVGYFTVGTQSSFSKVFGPTMTEIRRFTRKPFLIIETASEAGKPQDAEALFKGVAGREDTIGFIWFNYKKRADWRLQSSPSLLREFKHLSASDVFGFDVRKP